MVAGMTYKNVQRVFPNSPKFATKNTISSISTTVLFKTFARSTTA
jgi:hypothetical protein